MKLSLKSKEFKPNFATVKEEYNYDYMSYFKYRSQHDLINTQGKGDMDFNYP